MNSYMRQVPMSADQMHSFLKDKQAWENAIAMYQGPDPLDHWYNYVCWYENHGHGDPENKFRETLERCLTLYEHSDYYKQDPRMVRLWLKYIDMQPNPLHFYQVLYQRGAGRQIAAFYIGWAGYYESINAIKEAESVYNLGFQEKAHSYEELHHAYSKLLYTRSTLPQTQYQQRALQMHPHQQQHSQHLHQLQNHTQHQSQPQPQPQPQHLHQQVQYAQPHNHLHLQPHLQMLSPQLQSYRQNSFQEQHHHHSQIQMSIQQQQQQHHHQQQQQQQQHHQRLYQQLTSYQQSPQQLHLQQQTHVVTEELASGVPPVADYIHTESVQLTSIPAITALEQQLPAASPRTEDHLEQIHHSQTQSEIELANHINKPYEKFPIAGIQLPRKFATYCRNNYETWKPALFLEEPADPCRHCHYPKELVYPGTGHEYSPEEIRARKYVTLNQENVYMNNNEGIAQLESLEDIRVGQRPLDKSQLQQLQQNQFQRIQTYYAQEHQQNVTCTFVNNESESNRDSCDEENEPDEEDDELNSKESQEYQQSTAALVNTADDLEDQIEASTIRFSTQSINNQQVTPNKTIKIKFKKERPVGGESLNGGNYSAYTIESIYQQEIESPNEMPEQSIRKNGHSFHPYILGQTSTPKTSSKRTKTKIKKINKLQILQCSSSNSSSTDNAAGNGPIIESIQSCDNAIQNATFNDNANYSFSSAVALDNSNCSITSAVGRLNFRDISTVANASVADFSTYQENSFFAAQRDIEAKEGRLRKALETIERHFARESIDPFNSELCRALLVKLEYPSPSNMHANFKIIETPLPKIANTRTLTLPDGIFYNIDKEVGRGSYGAVYKATDGNTGALVALKYQKPPNTWEIYICNQVLQRIKSQNVLPGLMDISCAIIAPNASLIATEFSPYGTLLDVNNKLRTATTKVMHESLVMHFSAQICQIIDHLHKNNIIHADIKPDNFLLMRIPNTDLHFPSLRLIDFGCAIDMSLFPEDTKFSKVIQTDGFTCVEMQENRPWSYETDLFCIAGTVHVMLFGEYMQLQKRTGVWDIKQKLPRYLKKHLWTKFFNEFLNMTPTKRPDLSEMRSMFIEETSKMDSELQNQIRTLSNILHRR